MNPQDLIGFFVEHGPPWVQDQRGVHRSLGRPLLAAESQVLTPFLDLDVLEGVRITTVPFIPNPDFYRVLTKQRIPIPIDFSTMSGMTFGDTILISQARPVPATSWMQLLFHECVHVVQYGLLGVDEFVRQYVSGWAEHGFQYHAIPLERVAYDLDARFGSNPTSSFSVRAKVAERLGLTG